MMKPLTLGDHCKVFALYALLSVGFTWPLALNLDKIPAGDGHVFVHAFWWFKKALSGLANPFFTDYILYPEGTSLVFQSTTFSNFLLTLPVSILAGPVEAVNVAYLLGYAVCGYAVFLLAHDLTGNRPAAVVAGIIYAFLPFHFAHGASHLNISTLQWLPLYLFLLRRAMVSGGRQWAVLAGLMMGWIVLTDQLHSILAALVTVCALPLMFLGRKVGEGKLALSPAAGRNAVNLAIVGVVAVVVSSGYLYQVANVMAGHPDVLKIGPFEHGGANMFSGDLAGYFVPPAHNPLWGKLFTGKSPGGENVLFLGYLPLLLAAAGLVTYARNGMVRFIAAISLGFWILSLGTTLHVNGVWQWGGDAIKMPFLALINLPVIGEIRTPCRFAIVTFLGVSLLAAYGMTWLSSRFPAKSTKLAIVAGALVLLEFMPPGHHAEAVRIPEIYRRMAQDVEPYTVLEMPLSRWSSFARNGSGSPSIMMYYQTVHGKKILNGLLTRAQDSALDFRNPFLDHLAQLNGHDNSVLRSTGGRPSATELADARRLGEKLAPLSAGFFKQYNIRYVLLHDPIASGTVSRAFLEAFAGATMIDQPGDGIAYLKIQ